MQEEPMEKAPTGRPGLLEAFWLLSALRVAVRTAAAVRARREAPPLRVRLRREVRRLRRLLDRLQLALLYADVVGDQTLDAALLRRFDLLLTAREVADAWRTLHQDLLQWYPEVSAPLVEAVRRAACRFDRLDAEAPAIRWQAALHFGNRVLRAVRRALRRKR
ncbi:hypothetical protein [Rhodothermus marinus]|nr:hypothetical protein [Rhodothermus marinus]